MVGYFLLILSESNEKGVSLCDYSKRKDIMNFKIRPYGRTELAQLYSPDIAPESAWKKFKRWINHHPTLSAQLRESGYNDRQRTFTPLQVTIIIEALGEP